MSDALDSTPAPQRTDPGNDTIRAHAHLNIARGKAAAEVQRATTFVTTSNEAERCANAMERIVR